MIAFSQIPFVRGGMEEQTKIYNLASYIEGFERTPQLDPLSYCFPIVVTDENEQQFDSFCANLWRTNPTANRTLVRIMIDVYNGMDVILLFTEKVTFAVHLVESLSKYIQELYGIIVNRINTVDDIPYIKESVFSIEGVQLLDLELNSYRMTYGYRDLPNDPPEDYRI